MEFFTDKAEAWENTLHSLRRNGGDRAGHVTELDPDASTRQKKPLAELDREDESRLQRYLFALVRSGQFDKAQAVCHHVGQVRRKGPRKGPYGMLNTTDDQRLNFGTATSVSLNKPSIGVESCNFGRMASAPRPKLYFSGYRWTTFAYRR